MLVSARHQHIVLRLACRCLFRTSERDGAGAIIVQKALIHAVNREAVAKAQEEARVTSLLFAIISNFLRRYGAGRDDVVKDQSSVRCDP